MKEIKFEGGALKVPTSWSDVTLGEYETWRNEGLSSQEAQQQYVADICKISMQELTDYPAEVYAQAAKATSFAFETDFEPQYSVEIAGEKWFLSSSDKLSLGEWVDMDAVLNNEDEPHRLSQMLAILCRPAGEKYDVEISAQRVDIFQQMTCDKALPLASFFLRKNESLDKTLNQYSQVAAEANQFLRDIKTFAKSGIGTKRLPIWQRIKFYFLTKSLEKQLSRFSDLCSIR